MSKPAVVTVSRVSWSVTAYEISILTSGEAAARAAMFALHHCFEPPGGYIVASEAILALIPRHLHFIAPVSPGTGTRAHDARWPEVTSDAVAKQLGYDWLSKT